MLLVDRIMRSRTGESLEQQKQQQVLEIGYVVSICCAFNLSTRVFNRVLLNHYLLPTTMTTKAMLIAFPLKTYLLCCGSSWPTQPCSMLSLINNFDRSSSSFVLFILLFHAPAPSLCWQWLQKHTDVHTYAPNNVQSYSFRTILSSLNQIFSLDLPAPFFSPTRSLIELPSYAPSSQLSRSFIICTNCPIVIAFDQVRDPNNPASSTARQYQQCKLVNRCALVLP